MSLRLVKKLFYGLIVCSCLVTNRAGIANAVDPEQCIKSAVRATNIALVGEFSNGGHLVMYGDIEELVFSFGDDWGEVWSRFTAKYGCLLSTNELAYIKAQIMVLQKSPVMTWMLRKGRLNVVFPDVQDISLPAANKIKTRLSYLTNALRDVELPLKNTCQPCRGTLVKKGTISTLRKVGIGFLTGAIALSAKAAFGVADFLQCTDLGSDDMISAQYTEVADQYFCQQADLLNCTGRTTNYSDCSACCNDFNNYPNQTMDGGVALACDKQCRDTFSTRRYCSNTAGDPNASFDGNQCQ